MCHSGLVQNTEVQLECEQVWIGSFRAKAVGHLRVKADSNPGLFVSIDANTGWLNFVLVSYGCLVICKSWKSFFFFKFVNYKMKLHEKKKIKILLLISNLFVLED